MPRRTRLTPQLIDDIVKRIRAGVYPYIAAQAVGVPRSTFYRWMEKGSQKGARGVYRDLVDRVLRASATARAHAEIRVFKDQPLAWLKTGPGREGWSESQTLRVEGGEIPVQVRSTRPSLETMAQVVNYAKMLGLEPLGGGDGQPGPLTLDVDHSSPGDGEDGKPCPRSEA